MKRVSLSLEENRFFQAVRGGMLLAVPLIMTGSVALLLLSFPVEGYREWLNSLWGGAPAAVLSAIRNATLGVISLILLLTVSFSYGRVEDSRFATEIPFVSLAAYLVFSMNGAQGFTPAIFESAHLFDALLVAVTSSALFVGISRRLPGRLKSYTAGADDSFNAAVAAILPAIVVVTVFALLHLVMVNLLGATGIQPVFSSLFSRLFDSMGRSLFSGVLFLFLLHLTWMLGIHGGNVLDGVALEIFAPGIQVNAELAAAGQAPTEIVSKTFLDTFALFGGCGALLCLAAAILLCERRKSVRSLTKLAAAPLLFNMNELMLFGIPVVLSPVYLIPFIGVPLVLTVISYGATALGLVPHAVNTVEWTTPIFFSGYAATGSLAGSVLQLFNLVVGTLLYIPFVRQAEKRAMHTARRRIEKLTELVKQAEQTGERPALLSRRDLLGTTAKNLVSDLTFAIKRQELMLYYQPQMNADGTLYGAEALLRWNHPVGGMLYPPLVIALAEEAGLTDDLGDYVIDRACRTLEAFYARYDTSLCLSVNITADQLRNPLFAQMVETILRRYSFPREALGLELTEQTALFGSPQMTKSLRQLHETGTHILLDDFGMGHSSLSYLQNSPFDVVKLDGSLVGDVDRNERSREILSTILYLSRQLHFHVIAEYVETTEQREALRKLGCVCYQGYLYSPAVPFESFCAFTEEYGIQKRETDAADEHM